MQAADLPSITVDLPQPAPAFHFSFGLPARTLARPSFFDTLRDLLSLLLVFG
ncbi:MAG: hypothetical protein ABIJ09_21895 [Pseudomonadota bacterium]